MDAWPEIRKEGGELVADHYRRCLELVRSIEFNSEDPQQLVSMCLYCSILELCPSLLILIDKSQFIAVPQLIRSMYEADVDLINALEDRQYFKSLYAAYLATITNLIQEAHDSKAPGFLKASGGIDVLREFLKEKRGELHSLKKDGHRPLTIAQRFRRAQRDEEYVSAYAHLCGHAHNDIASLEARHLRKGTDGGVELVLFEDIGPRRQTHLIDLADGVMLGASARIHEFFESGRSGEIDQMRRELNSLRERWPDDGDEA